DGHDVLSIRHQLIRGAVYRRLDEESRQGCHRRIARYLSRAGHGLPWGETAAHFHRGGVPAKAYRYALRAAEDARERGAFQDAVSMLEMASATAPSDATLFESLRQLGQLCALQGLHVRAAERFAACAEAADRLGDPAGASHARLASLKAAVDGGTIASEALFAELDVLEKAVPVPSPDHVQALDLRIRVADDELVGSAAREALRRADALVAEEHTPVTECLLQTLRTRHVCYGDPDTAVRAARSALRLVEEHGLHDHLGSALKRFLVVLTYRGLLDSRESGRLIERAKSVFREKGDQRGLFDVLINYGVWLSDTGRFDEARRYFLEAGEIVRELEDAPEYAVFACNMGEFHLYQHDYLAAKRYFKAAHRVGSSSRRTVRWVVAGGLGLCALHTGELGIVEELHGFIP
ncbi:MAG TPA: tetratricopeptide repeat protein, partial [Longimicrobiales bacterium]|nr:tetratricopeptide repeat protein [Longimicrobiales bacterium]